MRHLLVPLAVAVLLLPVARLEAAVIFTGDLVTVVAGAPGTWTFSVGGWDGGGTVTGSFSGTDADANGQLDSFAGEVTDFSAAYSGGTIVGPVTFSFANLFGLVYDLNGGPLGDGLHGSREGIGATSSAGSFWIGPGPRPICGVGVPCGDIEGQAVPEPAVWFLLLSGLAAMKWAGLRHRQP